MMRWSAVKSKPSFFAGFLGTAALLPKLDGWIPGIRLRQTRRRVKPFERKI